MWGVVSSVSKSRHERWTDFHMERIFRQLVRRYVGRFRQEIGICELQTPWRVDAPRAS